MGAWAALALVPGTAVVLAVVAVRRSFVVVTVSGASMAPALEPGDRVLVRRGTGDWLRAGMVVVLRQPEDGCRPEAALPSPPCRPPPPTAAQTDGGSSGWLRQTATRSRTRSGLLWPQPPLCRPASSS